MLLHDQAIALEVGRERIRIEPFAENQLQPASYDVRLGGLFILKPDGGSPSYWPQLLLGPGMFVLGTTIEKITLPPDIAARIEGKSSLGRKGLMLHSTAGWIDPGFSGQITLELSNISGRQLWLTQGMAIGQIAFMRCEGPAQRPYGHPDLGSKYQNQQGPVGSRGMDLD